MLITITKADLIALGLGVAIDLVVRMMIGARDRIMQEIEYYHLQNDDWYFFNWRVSHTYQFPFVDRTTQYLYLYSPLAMWY